MASILSQPQCVNISTVYSPANTKKINIKNNKNISSILQFDLCMIFIKHWNQWAFSGHWSIYCQYKQCSLADTVGTFFTKVRVTLTLNVRGLSYLGLTRSISWLLMPWLLMSPGHQQPWYWLYRICRSFSYLREDFKYLCHINVDEWHKM